MLRIRPTPAPRTDVRTRTKRPPLAYIELLSAPEDEFRDTVKELEADPLFRELHALGAVRRRGGRGRMPAEAYESRLDADVARFVKRYGMAGRKNALDWVKQQVDAEGAQAVARRLGAPIAEVRRVQEFLRGSPSPDARRSARRASDVGPDLDDFVAGTSDIDITEATETVRDFVERFSLSQHQLVADFLHSERTASELAHRYRTTPEVIGRVMRAVNFVLTADIVGAAGKATPARLTRGARADSPPVVARVHLRDGEPFLQFTEESGYGLRYLIDPRALDELGSADKRARAEELLAVLRHVNQRRSVQCRVVAAVFEEQARYFASGDELDLRPLSQADLARELKEHQSTVSRAVRGRYIDTPYGTHELQYYCQRKRDVVLRLSAAHPDLSDRELQRILKARHGCDIARRTVAYHRRAHRK